MTSWGFTNMRTYSKIVHYVVVVGLTVPLKAYPSVSVHSVAKGLWKHDNYTL